MVAGPGPKSKSVWLLEEECLRIGVSFLYHRTDVGHADLELAQDREDSAPPSLHPFGDAVDLLRQARPDVVEYTVGSGDAGEIPPDAVAVGNGKSMAPPAANEFTPDPVIADELVESPAHVLEGPSSNVPASPGIADVHVVSAPPAIGVVEASPDDRRDFKRLDKIARRGVEAFMEAGIALYEIRERKLWKAGGHATWENYVRGVLGMSKPHAHRLVAASQIAVELAGSLPNGNDRPAILPVSEAQLRPLSRLKDPQQRADAWQRAVERCKGQPTGKDLSNVVAELMGDDDPSPPVPSKRQNMVTTYDQLRVAVAMGEDWDCVKRLVADLGSILNLSNKPAVANLESVK